MESVRSACTVSENLIGVATDLLISDVVARISSGNRCVFYFLNILIDTTLGVYLVTIIFHLSSVLIAFRCRFNISPPQVVQPYLDREIQSGRLRFRPIWDTPTS
jgi:hypothetical protein